MNFQDEQYDSEWYKRDKYEEESEVYRSEEHTSELQSPCNLVCRLLLEKKKILILPIAVLLHDLVRQEPHQELADHFASAARINPGNTDLNALEPMPCSNNPVSEPATTP